MRMKTLALAFLLSVFGGAWAQAHAFLDHASPAVGSPVLKAPQTVTLWFTEQLEPAFSNVQVLDETGNRVDLGWHADAKDASIIVAVLKPLSPGLYKVMWKAVSIDTHVTNGDFTFRVTGA